MQPYEIDCIAMLYWHYPYAPIHDALPDRSSTPSGLRHFKAGTPGRTPLEYS